MSKKTKMLKSTSGAKEDKLVRITFDAPASLRKSFKLKAAQEERSLKEIFCELMESYVKNNE